MCDRSLEKSFFLHRNENTNHLFNEHMKFERELLTDHSSYTVMKTILLNISSLRNHLKDNFFLKKKKAMKKPSNLYMTH